MNAKSIAAAIVEAAASIGGDTWGQIRKSAPIFIRGYAQAIADIAAGVSRGDFSKHEARMYEQNARLLLVMGIANTNHILLFQAQRVIDEALKIVRTAINDGIGIALI